MNGRVRRVVTAETRDGKGVFSHIEEVAPLHVGGGIERYISWGWDSTPTLPVRDPVPVTALTLPQRVPGKVQIETFVMPAHFPSADARLDAKAMHATDTIDICFVISGAMCLRTASDEREVTLRPGDVLIQNGALHSWRNPFDEPCVMSYVFLGADRAQVADDGLYTDELGVRMVKETGKPTAGDTGK